MRRHGVFGTLALLLVSAGVSAQQAPAADPAVPGGPVIQLPAQPAPTSAGTPAASQSHPDTGGDTTVMAPGPHCGHASPTS